MEPITVETTEQGQIFIRQDDVGDGEPVIVIDPSQVPLLVKWLQEGAAELERDTSSLRQTDGQNSRKHP